VHCVSRLCSNENASQRMFELASRLKTNLRLFALTCGNFDHAQIYTQVEVKVEIINESYLRSRLNGT
jgi:predicted nuclease of predicted toxin-antitoxin system